MEKKAIPIIFIISILVLAVPFSAFGIVYDPVIEIVSPIPETFGNFGRSVSISGHNVLVGHVGDNTGADSAGAAYIYDSDGNLLLTILNPTPVIGDNFGNAVSIDGNNVLVGVQKKDTGATDAGVAYYFDITTCDADDGSVDGICEAATLEIQNPTPVFEDWFGYSVSISGNNVLVGAVQDDTGATDAGTAYYFDLTTCDDDTSNGGAAADGICEAATMEILNPTPVSVDLFGLSVSISGNNVLVGVPGDDPGASAAGTAYYFDITTCDADDGSVDGICEAATLEILNPTPVTGDSFGWAVSISGNSVLVGATQKSTGSISSGAAYYFDITTCDADDGSVDGICEAATLEIQNPTPVFEDWFGYSVSISGNNVLVGAFQDDTGASQAGAAYLFELVTCDDDTSNGGTAADGICEAATMEFLNPSPAVDDFFGYSVSISGNNTLIGAYGDGAVATDSGAAYLFLENSGGQVLGSVNILGTCGITFVGGNTIAYNDLEPGATSPEEILTVQNTGTIASNVLVSGTNWVDEMPVTVMLVGETAFSDTTGNYASKTSLSGTPTLILDDTQYIPDTPVNTYWQLLANLIDPDFVGSLTQEMTFTVDC